MVATKKRFTAKNMMQVLKEKKLSDLNSMRTDSILTDESL